MPTLDTRIAIILIIVTLIILWFRNRFTYWQRRGVATQSFTKTWSSTLDFALQKKANADVFLDIYNEFKSKGVKHCGIYMMLAKFYIPIDIKIVKHILQTDFSHFVDRGMYVNEKVDPVGAHLFSLEGKKWSLLRNKLTPTFTPGKTKMMFETVVRCTQEVYSVMDDGVGKDVRMEDILSRYSMDVIGTCAFGIECNSLRDPNNDFVKYGKKFVDFDFRQFCIFVIPQIMRLLNIKSIPGDVGDFFMNLTKSTVEYRERHQVFRKDFMHLLIQLKNRGKLVDDEKLYEENITESENKITMNEIAAQCMLFFVAGYETSTSATTFSLYELAKNKHIQEKVRQEIRTVLAKHGGVLTYEALMEMHYLDHTVNEALRKYPTLPDLARICTKEYKVPGTDLVLEKGTRVEISVIGIQRDPEYYPDPEKFDPDRFLEENKRKRPPCTFLPFGEGPRICIGLLFGMMQTKIGLVALLLNYDFSISKKTVNPLEYDVRTVLMAIQGGLWLNYKKIAEPTIELLPK